jgi:hypothetical protein
MIFLGFHFGAQDGKKEKELRQHLLEMELRECEVNMDLIELRTDVTHLRAKQPIRFSEAAFARVEEYRQQDAVDPGTPKQQSTTIAPSPRRPIIMALGGSMHSHSDPTAEIKISFEQGYYPCYVLPLTRLMTMTTLPVHEDALDLLDVLTKSSLAPNSAFSYFISQNWECFGSSPHPDNNRSTKLHWLKNIRAHLGIPADLSEIWIWWCATCPHRSMLHSS